MRNPRCSTVYIENSLGPLARDSPVCGEKLLLDMSVPRPVTVDACGEANVKMLVTLEQTLREIRDEVFLQQH